ncbi:MAG: AgmX/PglI C-terminal domain-containing protein, partial [Deltaproteobacteria bacterium]|nr:AgmX/PglI C-terminal domain-containing protein [Nannocystaceae bacterium]
IGAPPVKPSARVRGGGSKAEVTGSLDPEVVRRHVKRHVGEVRSCYEKALAADPSLAGKLTLTFTIRPDGTVSSSRISASTVPGDEVGDCVVAASKRWTFPEPEGGGAVVVNYPFVLASSG